MYYRSYGLLLVIVAVLIVAGRTGDNKPLAACIAGLILLVDLPIRFIGNVVPWREYDVPYWPLSPYRGSHVFFIPTWLWGIAGIVIGMACFVSPQFQALLDRKEAPNPVVQEPPVKPPVVKPPPPEFEIEIRQIGSFDGRNFWYTLHNRTGQRLETVELDFRYGSPVFGEKNDTFKVAHLNAGETRGAGYLLREQSGADWLHANVKARTSDKREYTTKVEWKR
jgi:hypothetical protein